MTVLAPIVLNWDGPNRRIYLHATVGDYFPIEDLYHEYRNARRLDETLRGFDALLKAEGNVPKGAGAFTPRYVVLLDGTKIVPFDNTLQVNQLGDIITDDPDTDPLLYDTTALTVPKVIYIKPSEAETIQLNSIAIEYSSYNQGITFAAITGVSGTEYPIGTPREPSGDMFDAAQIAATNGFSIGYIVEDMTFVLGLSLAKFTFIGVSKETTHITLPAAADVSDCIYERAHLEGTFKGTTVVRNCVLHQIDGICGFIEDSILDVGYTTLAGALPTHFLNCWSGEPGITMPIIDMGGSGQSLAMRNYTGGVEITNKSGPESVSIDLSSGQVIINNTVTNGTIVLRGVGKWTNRDTYTGGATVIDELVEGLKINEIYEKAKHISYTVYIDLSLAAPGDGSQRAPFNNLSTAIDHAELEGITDLIVLSDLTLARSMKNFRITGIGIPTIDTNGQDLTGTEFWHCQMEGTYLGSIIVQESVLKTGFWLNGNFEKNALAGDLFCVDGGTIFMLGNSSAIPGLGRPTISMNGIGSSSLRVGKNSGGLTIKDCNNALDVITVEVSEGALTFDASCTNGVMVARGTCIFEDLSTGAVVTDQTLSPVDAKEVWEAHYRRRKWDKIANTITQFAEDNLTPSKVFDTNADLSDITPQ